MRLSVRPALRWGFRCLLCLLLWVPVRGVARQGTGFYRAEGTAIVDPDGTPVLLRGVGLGGWLVPEGYMLHIAAPDGGSPHSIREQVEALIGTADADAFFARYRDHYVAEKDVAALAEWGFDHIRLPFHYDLFFDPQTETFREDGFAFLDTFLGWCRTYGLGVILDLHAAPGGQNAGNISDSDGTARLWTEPVPYQDQTVAIWTEIARRYADDPLLIGYDLLNEPVTPDGISGDALRALYERLATAIRAVDPHHILFIEGNFYATDFPALVPPFDDNMVYTFHKYWNGTQLNSIQYLLDLRDTYNVPLWLGETGENSNPWFFDVIRLIEAHGISWNFWTHKKIETTTAPLSAPFAPGYQAVVDYWAGAGPKPSADDARAALFAMADGLDLDSAVVRPGVLEALFNPGFDTLRRAFAPHVLPGTVNAADYDIGDQGVTYFDFDVMATTGAPGGGNNGRAYRNDGVDIEPSTDPAGFAYNVGWMTPLEWLTYTVDVTTTGTYDVEIRVASAVGGGSFRLLVDDVPLGADLSVVNTGGWQNWISVWLRGVSLTAGTHRLKLLVLRQGDFNVNRMTFSLVAATGTEPETPSTARLLGAFPNPFAGRTTVAFVTDRPARAHLAVFDVLGRRVYATAPERVGRGEQHLDLRLPLAPGLYVYRLTLDEDGRPRVFSGTLTVGR